MKKLGLSLVMVVVMLLMVTPVLASEGITDEIPSLERSLALLAQGAGVGLVLAFLAEKIPAFQKLDGQIKAWVIFGVSLGLPMLAQLLLQFVPVETWAVLEPYWRTLVVGFIGWAGSQGFYQGLIKPAQERDRFSKILE